MGPWKRKRNRASPPSAPAARSIMLTSRLPLTWHVWPRSRGERVGLFKIVIVIASGHSVMPRVESQVRLGGPVHGNIVIQVMVESVEQSFGREHRTGKECGYLAPSVHSRVRAPRTQDPDLFARCLLDSEFQLPTGWSARRAATGTPGSEYRHIPVAKRSF